MTNQNQPNRLINETSPYLIQHAYNPVDWWPWCDEAFAKAKAEDKPIFLSIGYSTCHWCHVMENESFVDAEVADVLNADFISIKVDKEERPDIDAVYMTVCQALTGSGGWPTTIIMTHEQKPFFAGTYFPKRNRYGHIGLMELLAAVREKWDTQRASLIESSGNISQALAANAALTPSPARQPDAKAVETALSDFEKSFDKKYGGFGGAPKFPSPHNLIFLLRCHSLGISENALGMAEKTLVQMYRGGIFDHIGGGFSRYSTDEKWLAPHFEKMLYDNALLAYAFLECFEITKNPLYQTVAERIFFYLSREMTAGDGGFYSAQDADSEGEEGKYYTFTPKETAEILGEDAAGYFCRTYDITERGNFESKSIPNLIAEESQLLPDGGMQDILSRLYAYRKERFELHKDDKILTSWNALAVAALAKAYRVLGDRRYLDSAEKALKFIEQNLTGEAGSLFISYRGDRAKGNGVLDDYAFLAWACLELYDATFSLCYLEKASLLAERILDGFSGEAGGFYLYAHDSEQLLLRTKEWYDGATPSGNSAAAYVLARLSALTAEKQWADALDKQLAFYSGMFEQSPTACSFALLALMQTVYPSRELVCVLADDADRETVASTLRALRLPQTGILLKTPAEAERLAAVAPFSAGYSVPASEKLALYLCQNGACNAPVYNFDALNKML